MLQWIAAPCSSVQRQHKLNSMGSKNEYEIGELVGSGSIWKKLGGRVGDEYDQNTLYACTKCSDLTKYYIYMIYIHRIMIRQETNLRAGIRWEMRKTNRTGLCCKSPPCLKAGQGGPDCVENWLKKESYESWCRKVSKHDIFTIASFLLMWKEKPLSPSFSSTSHNSNQKTCALRSQARERVSGLLSGCVLWTGQFCWSFTS